MTISVLVTRDDGTTSEFTWLQFERMLAAALGLNVQLVAKIVERKGMDAKCPNVG